MLASIVALSHRSSGSVRVISTSREIQFDERESERESSTIVSGEVSEHLNPRMSVNSYNSDTRLIQVFNDTVVREIQKIEA